MAALNFVKTVDLTQDSGPVDKLMIGNEPSGDLYQYYLKDSLLRDRQTHIEQGSYNDLLWSSQMVSITAKKCKRFGIKAFPNVGAIGFYTPLVGTSKMLIPIHITGDRHEEAPTLNVTTTSNTILFSIADPDEITYTCYRVLLEYGTYYAIEYVTYENTLEIPKPEAGTYTCYCIGYLGEGQSVSENSNEITLTI